MTFSSDELKRLWKINAIETRNGALLAAIMSWIFIITFAVAPLLMIFFEVLGIFFLDRDTLIPALISTVISGIPATINLFLIYRFATRSKRYFLRGQLKGNLVSFETLDKKISSSIIDTVHKLSNEMMISSPLIWLDRKSQASAPSVCTAKGKVYLLIPLPFLKLWSQDVEAASAVIAHELSHIIQDDYNYWHYPSAIIKMLVLQIIISIPFVLEFTIYTIMGITTALIFSSLVVRRRWKSEKAADLAGLAFVSPSAIFNALKYFEMKPRRNFFRLLHTHPTQSQREKNLEAVLTMSPHSMPEGPELFSVWTTISLTLAWFQDFTFPIPLILCFWAWKELMFDLHTRRGFLINLLAIFLSLLPFLRYRFSLYLDSFNYSPSLYTPKVDLLPYIFLVLSDPIKLLIACVISLPFIWLGIKFSREFRNATDSFQS